MKVPAWHSFADEFASVLETRHQDPLLRVLVLTYEFDERQLLNLVCAQSLEQEFELCQSLMATLCRLHPVVLYDARKTREFFALPQFLELHPVHAGPWACHHSKAYLLLTRDTVRLVLGSFNLTEAGIFRNREVFEVLRWDAEHREDLDLLRQWTDFLETHCLRDAEGSSRSAMIEIVAALRERIGEGDISTGDRELIFSGYRDAPSGLDRLVESWKRHFPGTDPDRAFVVSPFFDISPHRGCFALDLRKAFPSLRRLELVTSESGMRGLERDHFAGFPEHELLLASEEIDLEERKRLERQGLGQDTLVKRKLHAKLLCLAAGPEALIYAGSANFTRKAWGTHPQSNRELGLVQSCEDFGAWRRATLDCLSVTLQDHWTDIPETVPGLDADDDEGYAAIEGYPDFLGWVQLCRQPEGTLRFAFHAASKAISIDAALRDYRIEWRSLTLSVRNGLSQVITEEQLRERLVSGRNLSLVCTAHPGVCHWFPFQYDESLVEDRTDFIHPTVWDWFDFHLNPSRQDEMGFAECLPGQEDDREESCSETDREANPVIRMQAYLSRFTKAEAHFLKLLEALEECREEDRPAVFQATIFLPLRSLLHLLRQDGTGDEQRRIDMLFRIGELALFLKHLRDLANQEKDRIEELLDEVRLFLTSSSRTARGLERQYSNFVRRETQRP